MFKKIYNKYKKYSCVRIAGQIWIKGRNYKRRMKALQRIKKNHKGKVDKSEKLKIGFVAQDPNVWNKNKAIYEEMQKESQIELVILCVPDPFDQNTSSTYSWFLSEGYDCVDVRMGTGPWDVMKNVGEWIDVKSMQFDYLFYGQPYNEYYPEILKSWNTSQYTKVCIATYGMTTLKNFLRIRPWYFYCDVYCCYAQTEDEMIYNIGQFKLGHKLGIQRTVYFGSPVIEDFLKARGGTEDSWKFSKNNIRFIWTPRWTEDEEIGGSNFFRYKDVLLKYANDHKNVDILFRPHPMALDNFVRTGKMTADDVLQFRKTCNGLPNVYLDDDKKYASTFWNSTCLVTDISSIIFEYFVTGKPIIFCTTVHSVQEPTNSFEKVLSCCYVVNNEGELEEALNQIVAGKDVLKLKRQRCITEMFGGNDKNVARQIVDDFLADFYI